MVDIHNLIRPNVRNLKPYSSARDEFKGSASVWLDANENPNDSGLNRYPDPLQKKLKARISELKNLPSENIFLGNGSDEAIDCVVNNAEGSTAIEVAGSAAVAVVPVISIRATTAALLRRI